MRVYTLAKELGERFSIKLKSADLAKELREMPEFEHLRDSIKSHASSVDEEVAARVFKIYEERYEAPKRKAAEEEVARKSAEAAQRREEIRMRRKQFDQQKAREKITQSAEIEVARQLREDEMARRQKGAAALPAPGARPVAGIPLPSAKLAPIPIPMRQVPDQPSPAPPPTAQAAPAPPEASPQAPVAKGPIRPSAPATELKSSSGTTGVTSTPTDLDSGSVIQQRQLRPDGQPTPPPPPRLHPDSPFRVRPTLPSRPAPAARGAGPPPPGRPPAGQRPAPRGRGGRGAEADASAGLVIPEIGVMTLKTPGRRGREKSRTTTTAKKKGLKTIVREEIDIRPSKVYGLADEFRRPIARRGRPGPGRAGRSAGRGAQKTPTKPSGPVFLSSTITVGEFAVKVGIPVGEIIKNLMLMGQPLSINQLIEPDLCELLAQDLEIEIDIEIEGDEQDVEAYVQEEDETKLVTRPPVVTIMGHVDHGKTTLLDAYRKSTVASGEYGGITQHIGAYHVNTPRGEVVFLDTPGHEAFTAMRARGASVTDIIVLVVGADDGVMPQTVEAINHAKEAQASMIVAINKMDLPGANPERVRNELMQHSILPEALGGDTIFVEISAKVGTNLDQLLEMILLQAEVLELKADPTCRAEGTIIESHLDPLRGPAATVLINKGTLRCGDAFVVGRVSGRVRVMNDDMGRPVEEATPSHPVEVIGLSGTPDVGETFLAMPDERTAREIAERRGGRRRARGLAQTAAPRHLTLEGLHDLVSGGDLKELKVVLKADVHGSLEAVAQSLAKWSTDEVKVRILHQATGAISESDVQLASASDAIIIGFNVRPDPGTAALAEREGIEIKTYRVIYELIEEFQKALLGMLDKQYKEVEVGRVEIRQLFKGSRVGNIAGCMVVDGEVTRNANVRLVRDGVVVYEGKIGSLRRVKDDAAKVAAGYECGILLENFGDIKAGDVIEVYKMEEVPVELAPAS